jgi:hypothetical protein
MHDAKYCSLNSFGDFAAANRLPVQDGPKRNCFSAPDALATLPLIRCDTGQPRGLR